MLNNPPHHHCNCLENNDHHCDELNNNTDNEQEDTKNFCRLDEFPTEMISCILEYCDPRTMVDLICTCKRLRIITIQVLLSGKERHPYRLKGVPIIHNSIYLDSVKKITLPNEVLHSYLNCLMDEDVLEMDRMNLSHFAKLSSADMDNLSRFINKFKIEELIICNSVEVIEWIKRNNLEELGGLKRLSLVILEPHMFPYNNVYSINIPTVPLTVLHNLFLNGIQDIDVFCQSVHCSNYEELTVSVPIAIFQYAFEKILDKCINLRELEIRVHLDNSFYSLTVELNIGEETVQIMRNCKKLEELRIDAFFEGKMEIRKTVNNLDGIFPNLKSYSNYIRTVEWNGGPKIHATLIPKQHTLKEISVCCPETNLLFPKCDTFYLYQSNSIPEIDCRKLVIIRGDFSSCKLDFCQKLSFIPNLKELYMHSIYIPWTDESDNFSRISIEKLTIEKSHFERDFGIQLVKSSPQLREFYLRKDKVTDSLSLNQLEENDSNLRVIHVSDCSIAYSSLLEEIAKKLNFPHLESLVLENAYSVTKDILDSFIQKAENISRLRISGAEFNNELIGKYLKFNRNPLGGMDLSFYGKEITLEYLKNLEVIKQAYTFSIPDCIIDNNEMISLLDKMSRDNLIKIQINLGKSGPTIELLRKLQEFTSLQLVSLNGKPETKIAGFESFVLDEFLTSLPNIRLLYLESGEFTRDSIENAKQVARFNGKSAPNLIFTLEPFQERQNSGCSIL